MLFGPVVEPQTGTRQRIRSDPARLIGPSTSSRSFPSNRTVFECQTGDDRVPVAAQVARREDRPRPLPGDHRWTAHAGGIVGGVAYAANSGRSSIRKW